jgi:hypothetical protein
MWTDIVRRWVATEPNEGHIQISSPAGRGTTLLADIPLEVA